MDDPSNRQDHWNIINIFNLMLLLDFEKYVSSPVRVVRRGPVFRELLSVGFCLKTYPRHVGSWAARVSLTTRISWLSNPRKYKRFKKNWKSWLYHGRCLRPIKYSENYVFKIQSSSEWRIAEPRRVLAEQWNNEQRICVGSKYVRGYFCRPKYFDGRLRLWWR